MGGTGVTKQRAGEPDELLGATINGRYRVVSLIARGGMGKVYKAEQSALGRVCALKVLSPSYDGDKDPEFHRRFSLEAATAAKLTHPNTVTIFDFGKCEEHGVYYIAMEFLGGRTLHRVLHEEKALDEGRASHIAQQITRSLAEAHKAGIVHRDLKPSNVMLLERGDEEDFVKVLDFGLVKDVSGSSEELTQTGMFMGSPKYMAPEQVLGSPVSPRTDVYAVGVILYEMLTGKVPFDRKGGMSTLIAHVNEVPPPMRERNPEAAISGEMEAVVMRCLAKDPDQRYAGMRELLLALKRAGGADLTETQEGLPRMRLDVAPSSGEGTASKVSMPPPSATPPSVTGTLRSNLQLPGPPGLPDSLTPPPSGGVRSTSGPITAPRAPSWRAYALALGASIVGGGAAALLLSRQPQPVAQVPTASATAAVAVALPASADPPKMGPGIRIVTVESDPPGAGVSDQGVEVCMQTPCRVYWTGPAADAEHRLTLSRRGLKAIQVIVAPGQDRVMGKLEMPAVDWTAATAAPPAQDPGRYAPDPYGSAGPTATAASSAAPAIAAPPSTATAAATVAAAALPTATADPAPATADPGRSDDATTKATRVSGAQPAYPREAREAKVQGTVVAKCQISASGAVSGCRIIKPLPFMDQPVLAALSTWRFTPATRGGQPVAVDQVITIRIVPP
jgi:serine/threonine-protein kinase